MPPGIWKKPSYARDSDEAILLAHIAANMIECAPRYHTRLEICIDNSQMSASMIEEQAETDKHVNMLVSLGDADIICDIREIKPDPLPPTTYKQF